MLRSMQRSVLRSTLRNKFQLWKLPHNLLRSVLLSRATEVLQYLTEVCTNYKNIIRQGAE
jgi:hypothetical protein